MGKPYDDRELLIELYISEGMEQSEIADKFDVSASTISRKFSKFNIKKRHQDAEVLRELHYEKGLSLADMADELGVSPSTVHYNMERKDIEIRSQREGRQLAALKKAPSLQVNDKGYEVFPITDGTGGLVAQPSHHRLLAIAEYGLEASKDMDVHHKNGVPFHNRLDNLELVTESEHREQHWDEGLYDEQRSDA